LELEYTEYSIDLFALQKHRSSLLKELSARLKRDTLLRYAERELEMQKLLMGKGASSKIKDREKILEKVDEDEEDARPRRQKVQIDTLNDPAAYKPRVFKWKQERKT
jgi:U3 small nucleolar RNA-associated protein 11